MTRDMTVYYYVLVCTMLLSFALCCAGAGLLGFAMGRILP